MKAWTDYPFTQLGDISGQLAPVREVKPISFDGNKYVKVKVKGTSLTTEIKAGYLYRKEGRLGQVPLFNIKKLYVCTN